MTEEKIFADGFLFKRNENAPDFVVGRLSMKIDEAIAFLRKHEKGGWVNINIKQARSGNYYSELDTFEAKSPAKKDEKPKAKAPSKKEDDHELPF